MQSIRFDKAYAVRVLDAIKTNSALPAPPQGWDEHSFLTLAGIAYAFVINSEYINKRLQAGNPLDLHFEFLEAETNSQLGNLNAVTKHVYQLAFFLMHGEYDSHFEPHVEAKITQVDDDLWGIESVLGFKNKG